MVQINLSLGLISETIKYLKGKWNPSTLEKEAAWEFYVELITRISIQQLDEEEGIFRESLFSLYTLFQSTRQIMKDHGSAIASKKGDNELSFGYISTVVMNLILRPFLARWHPRLQQHESKNKKKVSNYEHEKEWEFYDEFRTELKSLQDKLRNYSIYLEEAIGIDSLIQEDHILPE